MMETNGHTEEITGNMEHLQLREELVMNLAPINEDLNHSLTRLTQRDYTRSHCQQRGSYS